ncbi:hypothetical protein [Tepidibacter formicigenes]|uniref:hypothetical protein n=1 Tax=Tepidibacter formicigenes TaxID=227138 RepID=UPI001160B064|nr:hypothetical protein [Tepidibacter formicigenes]
MKRKDIYILYKEETHPRAISITQKGMELIKGEIKEEIKFNKKDYKVLLAAEIFLRENGFGLI